MKMKHHSITAAFAALIIAGLGAGTAFAGNTAQQTVTYEVQAINELAVSSPTASLTVNSATAGSAPSVATDTSTSYAITTNQEGRKITGVINSNMPTGVTLSVTLAAPTGATSLGKQALSTLAADLVTGISTLNESSKGISYELAATSAAGVVASATKTVTLTITAGS
jgi:hypothetical protein